MALELDVGIVGCGTAGSAAAVFLARAGHRVTVYERVPNPTPVGAGITLQPTGIHVLDKLGLRRDVLSRGARIDRVHCVTSTNRTLIDLRYKALGEKRFGVGVHRGVVFQSLLHAVKQSGVTLRMGVTAEALVRAEVPVLVGQGGTSRRGPRRYHVVDSEGRRHGPHELLVVCDGARSQLRDDTDLKKSITPYPWGALWFVAEDRSSDFSRVLYQVVHKNQKMLGLLPTGTGPTGITPLVSLFWSLRQDRLAEWRERGLDAWKKEVLDLVPHAESLVFQIREPEEILFSGYHDVVMERWNTRSVVYLGDAAHAMSPQLGQGCNLALWDAMTLADCLAEGTDLPSALDAYSRARKDHLAFYQLATRWLTPFFQGDQPAFGSLRDLAMPLLTRTATTNRIMTLSMAGLIEGFSGKTLKL